MAAKNQPRGFVYRLIVTVLVFPLLLLNTYAFLQLKRTAEHWSFSFIPGSLSETMTQLAFIVILNSCALVFFLIYIQTGKKK